MTLDPQSRDGFPRSVAIIMDGNGRWAQERGRARTAGHRAGAERVDLITETAADLGVQHLTLYAFSTENWNRPRLEVEMLWLLLVRYLKSRKAKMLREGIRLTSVGRKDRIPARALRELQRTERETAKGDRMTLCLALDYGGLWDLQTLVQNVREADRAGLLEEGPLSEDRILSLLGSAQVPDVDLLIRPGGESRTSNYLPVQLRYAELQFWDKMWPDFDDRDLLAAFQAFASRHRRFGSITEAPAKKPVESKTESRPRKAPATPQEVRA